MNRRRMKAFANWLEKNKKAVKVDMAHIFAGTNRSAALDMIEKTSIYENCGTTGCACGWNAFAHKKQFRQHLSKSGDDLLRVGGFGNVDAGAFGFSELWFGLTEHEAYALFTPIGHDDCGLKPHVQLRRLLAVLRGEIELNRDWLISPTKVK